MTHSLPHPEPAQVLAFDLVRAQLDGDRGTVATLIADAGQTPGRFRCTDSGHLARLVAVLACTTQLAVELGRLAHGDDLHRWLRAGLDAVHRPGVQFGTPDDVVDAELVDDPPSVPSGGSTVWVGEAGPELARFPRPGRDGAA